VVTPFFLAELRKVPSLIMLLSVLLYAASAAVFAHAQVTSVCAVANALKVPLNATCTTIDSAAAGDIAASRGEFEALQILIDVGSLSVSNVTVSIAFSAGTPADLSWTLAYVGYVFCAPTTRYGGSGGGWRPDALMPWPASGLFLPPQTSLTAWVSFNVSAGAAPGTFNGTVSVFSGGKAVSALPFSLTIWPLLLPSIGDQTAFTTIYAYSPNFSQDNETLQAALDQLAALRFPATQIYLTVPYPLWYYEYLAAQGAPLLVLADVANLALSGHAKLPTHERAQHKPRSQIYHGRRSLQDGCPVYYNATYVSEMIAFLTPTVNALSEKGLLERAAVYGFDELVRTLRRILGSTIVLVKSVHLRYLAAIVLRAHGSLTVWCDQGPVAIYHHNICYKLGRHARGSPTGHLDAAGTTQQGSFYVFAALILRALFSPAVRTVQCKRCRSMDCRWQTPVFVPREITLKQRCQFVFIFRLRCLCNRSCAQSNAVY
jgi:hypothetical protein